jgi:hypothetical protein
MNKISFDKYPLFDLSYGNDIPGEQYFIMKFDSLPSKYFFKNQFNPEIKNYFLQKDFVIEIEQVTIAKTLKLNKRTNSLLINTSKEIMVRINEVEDHKDNHVEIELFYDSLKGSFSSQFILDEIMKFQIEKKKSNINLIKSEMGHLDTQEYDLIVPDMDLKLNYGTKFLKIHDHIVKRLNKEGDKGIILLHGDPGTGKCVVGKTKVKLRNKKTGEIYEKNIEDLM